MNTVFFFIDINFMQESNLQLATAAENCEDGRPSFITTALVIFAAKADNA